MFEIGPNLLLAVLFVCVAYIIMRFAVMCENIAQTRKYERQYLADREVEKHREITEQVRIAHAHVPRDCSCIKAT